MGAPDLFSPEDFEKLLADNFTAESKDEAHFIFSKNEVVGSEFPVGIYYPNAEHIEYLGTANMENPLVEYMMDNSLLTPEQFQYVDNGGQLSNLRLTEYGLGGFIFGSLIGGYAGYKVGRKMTQKKEVFKTEKQVFKYASEQLKKLEEKNTMKSGGNVEFEYTAVRDATNKDRDTFGGIYTFKKGDNLKVVRFGKHGDIIINISGRQHMANIHAIARFTGQDLFALKKQFEKMNYKTGGLIPFSPEHEEQFKYWIEDGNAIEIEKGIWAEQTTQWKKKFTLSELKQFFWFEYIKPELSGAELEELEDQGYSVSKMKFGGSVSDKVKRPYKVRFHLGAGKNFMTWRVENIDTKKVKFIDPDENRLMMLNCRLTNRPTTAKKIFSGEINKQPIAWIECEKLEIFNDTEVPMALDQIRFNPRENIHWHNNSSSNIDGLTFPQLVTYGRSVFIQDGNKFYELGGVIYDNNRIENFDSTSTEPFDSLSEVFVNGGEVGMKKVLENEEFEYYWDMEDEDNAYMIRKSDGQQSYGFFPMDSMYNDIITGNFTWVAPEMKHNVEQIIINHDDNTMKKGGQVQSPAEEKFTYVMREYGKGRLNYGTTGQAVTDLDMAVAIAYSEARKIDDNFGRKKMMWGGRIKGAIEYTFKNNLGATTTILITPLRENKWQVQSEVKKWSDKWKKPIFHSEENFWIPEEEMKQLKVKIMRKRPKIKKY